MPENKVTIDLDFGMELADDQFLLSVAPELDAIDQSLRHLSGLTATLHERTAIRRSISEARRDLLALKAKLAGIEFIKVER